MYPLIELFRYEIAENSFQFEVLCMLLYFSALLDKNVDKDSYHASTTLTVRQIWDFYCPTLPSRGGISHLRRR